MNVTGQRRRIARDVGHASLLAALALMAAGPAAEGRSVGVRVTIPEPGHAAVELVRVKVNATPGHRPGRRLRLRFPSAGSLPPSVKILYIRRTIRRKRSTIHGLLMVIVNRAEPKARAASEGGAHLSADDPRLLENNNKVCGGFTYVCIWMSYPGNTPTWPAYSTQQTTKNGVSVSAQQADTHADGAAAGRIREPLHDLFEGVRLNDNETAFVTPSGNRDPNLDTGHYDDGHSFGWGIKTKPEVNEVTIDLVEDLAKGNIGDVVARLETAGGVDLNGNGVIETPGQGGSTIDTTVGPPVIS